MAMYAEMVRSFQSALIVVAHPDDADSLAAGTVAKLTRAGTRVAYCIATNGEKGSGDRTMTPERLATIRQEEQRQAARVLGVHSVDFSASRIARSRIRGRPGWPSRPPSAATARISSWFRIRIGPSAWAPRIATIASWPRSRWTASRPPREVRAPDLAACPRRAGGRSGGRGAGPAARPAHAGRDQRGDRRGGGRRAPARVGGPGTDALRRASGSGATRPAALRTLDARAAEMK